MSRTNIKKHLLAVASGCSLALSCSMGLAATNTSKNHSSPNDADTGALVQLAESEGVIDTWRNYALGSLKAEFSWATEPGETVEVPSVFNRGRPGLSRAPALRFPGTSVQSSGPFDIAMQSVRASNSPFYAPVEANSLLPDHSPGLRRTVVTPSFTQRLGDAGFVSVSAILTYERFAGFDLSFNNAAPLPIYDDGANSPLQLRNHSTAAGAGGRIDFGNNLADWVGWQAGYQTRVNMDGFNTAEGLYAKRPGTFDIPGSTNAGLNFRLSAGFQADVGVERVMYSAIPPFVSTDLPPQLLVQIGSYRNTSLVWENLVVRSAGLSWHDATIGDLRIGVTSRQQPLPTLPALQQAVLPNLSTHSYELSYAHGFGNNSMLRFLGAYAPLQLLGAPTANYLFDSTSGTNQLRLEALWTTTF